MIVPHAVISDHILIEARYKKEGPIFFGRFMMEFFKEFTKSIGYDKNYIVLKETDFNKLIKKEGEK